MLCLFSESFETHQDGELYDEDIEQTQRTHYTEILFLSPEILDVSLRGCDDAMKMYGAC